jgi:hypothetical protein
MVAERSEFPSLPKPGCRLHREHVPGCKGCARSFVERVRWHLEHPDEQGEPTPLAFDPTPCGICGCVIGEGLMTLHINACHPPEPTDSGSSDE